MRFRKFLSRLTFGLCLVLMCPKGTRKRSRKAKDGAGVSGAGDASVPNPSVVLSVPPTGRTGDAVLTETQVNQTEVQLDGVDG